MDRLLRRTGGAGGWVACWAMMLLASVAGAQTAPAGWSEINAQQGVKTFAPKDLAANERLRVACLPLVDMKQVPLLEFTDNYADQDLKTLSATVVSTGHATGQSENMAYTYRQIKTADGPRFVMYMGISMDRRNARFVRVSASDGDKLLKKYMKGVSDINSQMIALDKKEAIASSRGVDIDKIPQTPKGLKPGGPIVPGIYAGNRLDDEGKITGRYRLYLYDDFEWRMLDDKGQDTFKNDHDRFSYSPANGKLNVSTSFSLYNDRLDPDEQYCLLGRDEKGKPVIVAYEDRGIGHYETRLQLVGPIDRISPEAEALAKKKLEAEKARYKLVVKPGEGLKDADIAGIFHDVTFKNDFTGSTSEDSVYLLLADGSIRDGLPVAPDELDVPLSKRREGEKWGRWEKRDKGIVAAWKDRPDKFEPVRGSYAVSAGTKIEGTFSSGMTTGNMITGSSWHIWGVTFTKDGRYEKFKRGGFSNGSLAQSLNDTYIFTSYDDEGSTVSADTPAIYVGSVKKKKKDADRQGTYTLTGWTLTLTADDGTITRVPCFFTTDDKTVIYFEGASLSRDKK